MVIRGSKLMFMTGRREGGERGMMGRKAQKGAGLLFVVMKIDLGLTHIYKSDNHQKTF